jgi:RNA polymerase sigma factor (sigma-70 family)
MRSPTSAPQSSTGVALSCAVAAELSAVPTGTTARWAPDSPEQAAILGEEHRDVLVALQRLPHRQREALILRYFLDLAEPQIAAAMGVSQGTVKSTTSRAIAALARHLREQS